MKCEIVSFAMSDSPFAAARAVHTCKTHSWPMGTGFPVESLCPIGRIEEARDQAIEAINEQKR